MGDPSNPLKGYYPQTMLSNGYPYPYHIQIYPLDILGHTGSNLDAHGYRVLFE